MIRGMQRNHGHAGSMRIRLMPLGTLLFLLLMAWPVCLHAQRRSWVDPRDLDSPKAPKNKTVIEMSVAELKRYCPSGLKRVEFSIIQAVPVPLLKLIGERVQTFFENFSDTSSKEKVLLQHLDPSGFVSNSMSQEFNYLMLYRPTGNKPFLEEFRTDKEFRPIEQKAINDFVITAGYVGNILHFHPQFQTMSEFRYLGKQDSGVHLIAFAHKNEENDLLVGFSDVNTGQTVRFPVQGIVWIDPGTYQILRMYTSLRNTGQSSQLTEQITDISFAQMHFENGEAQLWMPSEIVVSSKIANIDFLNHHHYSDYKLFTVNSEIRLEKPKTNK